MLIEAADPSATVTIEGFAYQSADFDPPATTLEDYYTTLEGAVRCIARARGNKNGFAKLALRSEPVTEFSYRLNQEREEARDTVVASARRHYHKAHDKLSQQNSREYGVLMRYARATQAFTVEEVFANAGLPADVSEVEFYYFADPSKTPAELDKHRRQLYARVKKYKQAKSATVA